MVNETPLDLILRESTGGASSRRVIIRALLAFVFNLVGCTGKAAQGNTTEQVATPIPIHLVIYVTRTYI